MIELIDLPRWVLEVSFVVYAVVVSVVVVLERRRPTATLALILALIFVPVVGLLAYVFLSRQRVRRRQRKRQRRSVNPVDGTRNIANLQALPEDLTAVQAGLVRLALETGAAPLRRSDAVDLLPTAAESFDAIAHAIGRAERSIHMLFYIWRDDETGRRITELLTEAASRGVRVRVLYDHLGSFGLPAEHFSKLRAVGGEAAIFGRLRIPIHMGRSRVNFRNHRKLMTVDASTGFVGGLNVGDEYLRQGTEHGWRDLLVRVTGDAAIGLEAIFLDDWLTTTGEVLDLRGNLPRTARGIDARRPIRKPRLWRKDDPKGRLLLEANPFAPLPEEPIRSTGPLVQVIASGPDIPVASSIGLQFSAAIASAQQRAWIATPYFIPDEPLSLILRTAALRGVDVRILLPDPIKNDHRFVAFAARSYYDELLEVGCKIFEYGPGMLHAKYLIIDDVAAIGSANMDVRSFHINYEVTAMFYDAEVTAALARVFREDLEKARLVRALDRVGLSLPVRFLEGMARLLSPLL
jgi:cardiolipin synthase